MMSFFARYGKWLGILTVTALLVAGAALVASAEEPHKLSPGMEETRKALRDLRKSHFERLRAEEKALIERAVSEGKITREEADRLLSYRSKKHGKGFHRKGHGVQAGQLLQKWEAWRARVKPEQEN